jgi:hypothetical protein
MSAISSDFRRSVFLSEPVSEDLLDNTFEGALLTAIFANANEDLMVSGETGMHYLGAREIAGEGELTFYSEGDLFSLIQLADGSGSRSAKALLPVLEKGMAAVTRDESTIIRIDLSELDTVPGGKPYLTIAEIVQDLLIEHPERCDSDFFTLNGSYHPDCVDPEHLGGMASFITADDILTNSTDGWISELMRAHRENKSSGPKI